MPDWQQTWGDTVDVFANTGIQFLDFEFSEQQLKGFNSEFLEELSDELIPVLRKRGDERIDASLPSYEFAARQLIPLFSEEWIPLPFFAKAGENVASGGPFNWVRARLSKSHGDEYSLQLAVDTTVNSDDNVINYQQPTSNDAKTNTEFELSANFENISKLIKDGCDDAANFNIESDDAWMSEWLKSNYSRFDREKIQQHPASKLEVWASYIAHVELLDYIITFPKLRLKHSAYSQENCGSRDVDLVLDVGNSRTCGLLIEIPNGEAAHRMDNVSQLTLRDFSNPTQEYDGLFESRVEFSAASFGSEMYSRRSGRNNAFLWPSFVRFGPEAIGLVASDRGNEAFSGLSSPKRYLWDDRLFDHKWRFHNWADEQALPRSLKAMMPSLNSKGESLEQVTEEYHNRLRLRSDQSIFEKATSAKFSKSALYGFMIIEIIAQAFRQINDAQYRANKGDKSLPRFLRKVIITLPTATPKQEQAIVKSKVRGAIKLLWSRMAKSGQVLPETKPSENVEWDEASCSQVMYLYSEIMEKFNKDITNYLEIFGKLRNSTDVSRGADNAPKNSIRLACADIGGGTTDLMVTTFYQEDVKLTPKQDFREGFRKAGDDLLLAIIEQLIIPKLSADLKSVGEAKNVDAILSNAFAKSVANVTASQKHRRRQFALKVLAPLALKILNADFNTAQISTVSYSDLDNLEVANAVKNYLEDAVNKEISADWSLENFSLSFSRDEVKSIVDQTFKLIFENISEIISRLDVDCVILTGRPSQNQLIFDLFKACCAISPSKIVSMSKYKTGSWYPFKSPQNTVGDPKSSVAVGAMLISLAGSSRLSGLLIPDDQFSMKPTDHFLGRYQNIGQINSSDVYLKPGNDTHDVKMMTDMYIGTRQLNAERWTATPLYKLYFIDVPNVNSLPYTVTLERKSELSEDALYEAVEIEEAVDANQRNRKQNVKIQLQTLGENDEYWLDSGAFEV